MIRVSECVVEGDEPTERRAEHDGTFDPEHVAENPQVIGPLIESPQFVGPMLAATVSTVVVVDDLCDLRQ